MSFAVATCSLQFGQKWCVSIAMGSSKPSPQVIMAHIPCAHPRDCLQLGS